MKQLFSNKFLRSLAIIVIAGLIGVLSYSQTTVNNVPYCVNSAGCDFSIEPKGQITDRQHGYPLSYKQTSTFLPEHNDQNDAKYAGYAEATTERQPFNGSNILINTVFWSALLFTIFRLISDIKRAKYANTEPLPKKS